jgi:EAL domain-containing protein (putative c-di-GMP-specific phosphodiesterase class I)
VSIINAAIAIRAKTMEAFDAGGVRALVADDDEFLVRTAQRALESVGYTVVTAADGEQAAALFSADEFDLVITDIDMPRLDGIGLASIIRAADEDIPIILITASVRAETAIAAVNLGIARYLTKPFLPSQLIQAADRAIGTSRLNRMRKQLAEAASLRARAMAEDLRLFDAAVDRLYMVYQPVVHWPTRSIYGHEALVRTHESGVPSPVELFALAERSAQLRHLGRSIRSACADAVPTAPADTVLFVNLHATDLLDPDLLDRMSALARVADRVVLEIAERASMENLKEAVLRIAELRALGFRIAIDDIGAGYAGLSSFALIEPEIVKLDMALVRDVDRSPIKRRLIAWFVELCKSMDIAVVAEGVETRAELDTLIELGCELFQGYLFAAPGPELRREIPALVGL